MKAATRRKRLAAAHRQIRLVREARRRLARDYALASAACVIAAIGLLALGGYSAPATLAACLALGAGWGAARRQESARRLHPLDQAAGILRRMELPPTRGEVLRLEAGLRAELARSPWRD